MKKALKTLKKYLIPHEENDHKPHLLRARSIVFVLIVAVAVEGVFLFGSNYAAPRSKLFGEILTNVLVDETNQSRTQNNLPQLNVSPLLMAAAQEKANDMAANGYFAHTSPAGLTPWYWFEKVGYGFSYAGENLAVNFTNSSDVTNAWMNSPEHRENILDTNFTQIGMATAQGTFKGQPATYVVELFGTPSIAPIAFVNNAAAANNAAPAVVPSVPAKPAHAPVKPVAVKPKPVVPKPVVVTVVASSSVSSVSSTESFVAVKGAETEALPASSTPVNESPVLQPLPTFPTSNPIQQAFVNPRTVTNYFYYLLMFIFAIGLGLNIFVKIRVQHPKIIFAGLLVIIVAGLFVTLNQNVALLHATVL